jgi:cytochrome b pre-mRNA-processing protein 3
MLKRLFKPRPARLAGESLYAQTVVQARSPALYAALGAPDTTEGRFELYSLHVFLLLERFKAQGEQAAETSQALCDTYISALDNTLREMGMGDEGVSKRMRRLGEAFYGRIRSYEAALAPLPDTTALEAMLARTVYADADASGAPGMAAYIIAQRLALAGQPTERLCAGEVTWNAA